MYTSGSCAAGYGAFAPGPRLVYLLRLGNATPVGGVLTVSTCGATAADTVLYLGTGCPTWFGSFNCLRGNDNAGDVAGQGCASNGLASTLRHVAASRVYYVQVGAAGGGSVVSGLSWSYALPTPSATASRTRSRTATPTRSRTRSATASRSRSRKAKRVA